MINFDPTDVSPVVSDVDRVIADVLRRRSAGEEVSDEGIVAAHPELMPELGEALRRLRLIGQARIAAENDTTSPPDATPPTAGSGPLSVGEATSTGMRFRILRSHARGGLGEVFVAHDEELHREVALKQIQERHADHPQSRARFLVEAEITGRLEHPGIVPVYGLGTDAEGRPFYAMRLIKGDSFQEAIDRYHQAERPDRDAGQQTLELHKLLGRFIDVCNAIEYAHSRGVLHRDLKPGNIMLGKYGETLVVDWGLAKVLPGHASNLELDELPIEAPDPSVWAGTQMGSALGTPHYMSPEQAAGRLDLLSPTTDVYSLGATLYCILTGRPPLEGTDVGDILRKVREGEIPTPRQVKKDVARALEAICLKAMAVELETRYSSPRALADDVEHWLADEPVSALRDSTAERVTRLARRHKAWTRAIAGVLATTVAASLMAMVLINDQRRIAESLARDNAHLAVQERTARERAERAAQQAREAKIKAQYQLALSYIEQGSKAAEIGDPTYGIAKFYQAYLLVPEGDTLRKSAHCLMGAWDRSIPYTLYHGGELRAVAFSPDGRTALTGSRDKTARLWDVTTGKPRGEPLKHDGTVNAVAFSPDGQTILTGSEDDTARLWDVTTGKPRGEPLKHDGMVNAVAFSPDGRTVLTGSRDQTARLWDVTTGKPRGEPLKHGGLVRAVAFSPDGRTVLTGGDDNTARLWRVPSVLPDNAEFLTAWTAVRSQLVADRLGILRKLTSQEADDYQIRLETTGKKWLNERRAHAEHDALLWRHAEADQCEAEQNWFAAAFHLNFLVADDRGNSELRARRDEALRKQGLAEQGAGDTSVPAASYDQGSSGQAKKQED